MVRGGSFIGVSLAGHVVEWSVGRNARRTVSLASLLGQLAFPAGESVHLAGFVSAGKLIVASETQLRSFDLTKSEGNVSPQILSFPAGSVLSLGEWDAHHLLGLSADRRIWSFGEGEQRSWNLPEASWRSMAIDSSGVVFVGGNDGRVMCGRWEKGEWRQVWKLAGFKT